MEKALLHDKERNLAGNEPLHLVARARNVVRMSQVDGREPIQLLLGVAENLGEFSIHVRETPIEFGERDTDRGLVEDGAQLLLARAQRFTGFLALRDVLKINGEALRRRIRADLEPRIQRRVKILKMSGDAIAHRATKVILHRRSNRIRKGVPVTLPKQHRTGLVQRTENFLGALVHEDEAPIVVERHEAISNCFKDVRDALVGFDEIAFGPFPRDENGPRILHRYCAQQFLFLLVQLH